MSVAFPVLTKKARIDPFSVTSTSSDISFNIADDFGAPGSSVRDFENSAPGLVSEGYVNCNFNPLPFSSRQLKNAEHYHTEFRNQLVFRIRSVERLNEQEINGNGKRLAVFPRQEYLATIQQANLTLAAYTSRQDGDLTLKEVVDMVAPMFVGIKPKNLFGRGLNGKLETVQPGCVKGHCEMSDIFSVYGTEAKHIREGDHLFIIIKKRKKDGLKFRPTLYSDDAAAADIETYQTNWKDYIWQLEPWFSPNTVGPSAKDLMSEAIILPAKPGKPAEPRHYVGHAFYIGWIKEIKTASHFRNLYGGELLPMQNYKRDIKGSLMHGPNPQRDMRDALLRQTIVVQLELNSQDVILPHFYNLEQEIEDNKRFIP